MANLGLIKVIMDIRIKLMWALLFYFSRIIEFYGVTSAEPKNTFIFPFVFEVMLFQK